METEKHWRSKAHYLEANTFKELCEKLTDFAKDRFVVAWQIFTKADLTPCVAIVCYKELEQ